MLDSTLMVTKRMSNNGRGEVWAHANTVEMGTRFVTASFGPWDRDMQSWLGTPSRLRGNVVSEVASLTTMVGTVYASFPFSDPPVVAREEIGVNTSTLAFLMLSGEKDGYAVIELAAREAGVELPTTQYINLKNTVCGVMTVAGGFALSSGSPYLTAGAAGLGVICGGMMLLEELVGHGDDDFWETDPDPDPLPPPPDPDPSGRVGPGGDR